jgi:hypothetical protein
MQTGEYTLWLQSIFGYARHSVSSDIIRQNPTGDQPAERLMLTANRVLNRPRPEPNRTARHHMRRPEMTELDGFSLEGRVNAHRELLIQLTATLLARAGFDLRLFTPGIEVTVLDQKEDPAIDSSPEYAVQVHFSAELRSIAEEAKTRLKTTGISPSQQL